VDRGVSLGQRGGFPTVVKLSFLDRETDKQNTEKQIISQRYKTMKKILRPLKNILEKKLSDS
jgi:hypothetical protein